jgi:hypothetical protein
LDLTERANIGSLALSEMTPDDPIGWVVLEMRLDKAGAINVLNVSKATDPKLKAAVLAGFTRAEPFLPPPDCLVNVLAAWTFVYGSRKLTGSTAPLRSAPSE